MSEGNSPPSSRRDNKKVFNSSQEDIMNTLSLRQPMLSNPRLKNHDILGSDSSDEERNMKESQTINQKIFASNMRNRTSQLQDITLTNKQSSSLSSSNEQQTPKTSQKSRGEISLNLHSIETRVNSSPKKNKNTLEISQTQEGKKDIYLLNSSSFSSQSSSSSEQNSNSNKNRNEIKKSSPFEKEQKVDTSSKQNQNSTFFFPPSTTIIQQLQSYGRGLSPTRISQSPTRMSQSPMRSGRQKNIVNISLITKIKLMMSRMYRKTSFYKCSQLTNKQLFLINDLSILQPKDSIQVKHQLLSNALNQYLSFIITLNPYSIYKMIWDMIVLIIMMFLFICIPLILSFNSDFSELFGQFPYYILSIILILDALINLNTGYYKNGAFVTQKYLVFTNYAKKILFIDFIGITPVLFYTIIPNQVTRSLLFLYFIKYKSITKIFKRIQLRLDLKTSLLNKIALLKLFLTILFIAHLFANFWVILPQLNQDSNWFIKAGVNEEQWYIKYMKAYYYITVTMVTVGYGDITPSNNLETFFSILTILLSCAVFAYSVNSIGFILEEINREQKNLNMNMQVINTYMEQKKISRELRYQIREYLEFFWREQNAGNMEQEQIIIKQLAHNLKQKLFIEANRLILKDNKIFSNRFSDSFMIKILNIVKEYKFTPQQTIFSKQQLDDSAIYFIESGKIELLIENEKNQKTILVQSLGKGEYFGEIGFYTGQKRHMSVRSKDFATLLKIERDDFLNLLKMFPKDQELFYLIKDQILYYQKYGQIGISCYGCSRSDHILSNCQFVQFMPNKLLCYGKCNYSPLQQRQQYVRVREDKFCTLIQLDSLLSAALDIQDNFNELMPQSQSSQSPSEFDDENGDYQDQKIEQIDLNEQQQQFILQQQQKEALLENNKLNNEYGNTCEDNVRIFNHKNNIKPAKSLFYQRAQQQLENNQIFSNRSSIEIQNSIIDELNEDSGGESDEQNGSNQVKGNKKKQKQSSAQKSSLREPPNLLQMKNNKLKRSHQQEFNFSNYDQVNEESFQEKHLNNNNLSNNSCTSEEDDDDDEDESENEHDRKIKRQSEMKKRKEGAKDYSSENKNDKKKIEEEENELYNNSLQESSTQNINGSPRHNQKNQISQIQLHFSKGSKGSFGYHTKHRLSQQPSNRGSQSSYGMNQDETPQFAPRSYSMKSNEPSSTSPTNYPNGMIPFLNKYRNSSLNFSSQLNGMKSNRLSKFSGSDAGSRQSVNNSNRQSIADNSRRSSVSIVNRRQSINYDSKLFGNRPSHLINGSKNQKRRDSLFLLNNQGSFHHSGFNNSNTNSICGCDSKKQSIQSCQFQQQQASSQQQQFQFRSSKCDSEYSVHKKINAIYDKLINTDTEQVKVQDFSLEFDKQYDYPIYFPEGNLSFILNKRRGFIRRNHGNRLTHFIPKNIMEESRIKTGSIGSNPLLNIKQISNNSMNNLDSNVQISTSQSPTRKSNNFTNSSKLQSGLLLKNLQQAQMKGNFLAPQESFEFQASSISPKKAYQS